MSSLDVCCFYWLLLFLLPIMKYHSLSLQIRALYFLFYFKGKDWKIYFDSQTRFIVAEGTKLLTSWQPRSRDMMSKFMASSGHALLFPGPQPALLRVGIAQLVNPLRNALTTCPVVCLGYLQRISQLITLICVPYLVSWRYFKQVPVLF